MISRSSNDDDDDDDDVIVTPTQHGPNYRRDPPNPNSSSSSSHDHETTKRRTPSSLTRRLWKSLFDGSSSRPPTRPRSSSDTKVVEREENGDREGRMGMDRRNKEEVVIEQPHQLYPQGRPKRQPPPPPRRGIVPTIWNQVEEVCWNHNVNEWRLVQQRVIDEIVHPIDLLFLIILSSLAPILVIRKRRKRQRRRMERQRQQREEEEAKEKQKKDGEDSTRTDGWSKLSLVPWMTKKRHIKTEEEQQQQEQAEEHVPLIYMVYHDPFKHMCSHPYC